MPETAPIERYNVHMECVPREERGDIVHWPAHLSSVGYRALLGRSTDQADFVIGLHNHQGQVPLVALPPLLAIVNLEPATAGVRTEAEKVLQSHFAAAADSVRSSLNQWQSLDAPRRARQMLALQGSERPTLNDVAFVSVVLADAIRIGDEAFVALGANALNRMLGRLDMTLRHVAITPALAIAERFSRSSAAHIAVRAGCEMLQLVGVQAKKPSIELLVIARQAPALVQMHAARTVAMLNPDSVAELVGYFFGSAGAERSPLELCLAVGMVAGLWIHLPRTAADSLVHEIQRLVDHPHQGVSGAARSCVTKAREFLAGEGSHSSTEDR